MSTLLLPRPINSLLHSPRNTTFTSIELGSYNSILRERTSYFFSNLTYIAFGIKLLPYRTFGGDDTRILETKSR